MKIGVLETTGVGEAKSTESEREDLRSYSRS